MNSNKPLALVGANLSGACKSTLDRLGFEVITLPPYEKLGLGVKSHADLLIFPIESKIFTYREYAKLHADIFSVLTSRGYDVVYVSKTVGDKYPDDIALNALSIGKALFARLEHLADEIKQYALQNGYKLINVKQGYARCTAAPIGDSGIITADRAIAEAAKASAIDVIEIQGGDVALPPFEYGFIGGASGYFDDTVFFSGDITTHSSFVQISDFCKEHKKELVSLSNEPLNDVGSIFFLK